MTMYNNNNNISEDYAFVLNMNELFYDKEDIPTGIFTYNVSQESWIEIAANTANFDTQYQKAKNFVKAHYQTILDILDPDANYTTLLEEAGASNELYMCIATDQLQGFPAFNANQYFITIISQEFNACIPVKTFVLYSNTRIMDDNDIEINDLEYLSAKQCLNLIQQTISKFEILKAVDELPIENIGTNCIYLLYDDANTQDDGLNFGFSLWVYSETEQQLVQIDQLTFDIQDYALKTHVHGQIKNNGAIGSTSGLPIITANNGILTTGRFGTSSSTIATDFVNCSDSRLSDRRDPKAHTHSINDLTDLEELQAGGGYELVQSLPTIDDPDLNVNKIYLVEYNNAPYIPGSTFVKKFYLINADTMTSLSNYTLFIYQESSFHSFDPETGAVSWDGPFYSGRTSSDGSTTISNIPIGAAYNILIKSDDQEFPKMIFGQISISNDSDTIITLSNDAIGSITQDTSYFAMFIPELVTISPPDGGYGNISQTQDVLIWKRISYTDIDVKIQQEMTELIGNIEEDMLS